MIASLSGAVGLIVLCCSLAGCASDPPREKPAELPGAFDNQPVAAAPAWPGRQWYQSFASPELTALIQQASGANLDLAMASDRVLQADARARQAGAAILPSVDAGGNANYLAGRSSNGSAHETDWAALVSTSYEVDFWGKNRAAARSARYLASASHADRETLQLTTLAAVANGYFLTLSLRERLTSAEENLSVARTLLAVIQARFDVGMANPVELAGQRATLAAAALAVPELRQQESEALSALALLLGRLPEGFDIEGRSLRSIAEPAVTAGLPAELLMRRPDIFSAEANMQSAHADLAVARAALFPSLTLTASGGLQNPALQAAVLTLSGVGPTLNVGASLAQTIFDGGRLWAVRSEAQAKDEELIAAYRAAILSAVVDVENSLSAIRHLDEERQFRIEAQTQSERAFDGATVRYREGSGDYLTLLESQRALYASRDQLSQYRLARLQALVSLCKALGGGWQADSDSLASAQPVVP